MATIKNVFGQPIEEYTANIELNSKIIGTFFTQWYFYYGNQLVINEIGEIQGKGNVDDCSKSYKEWPVVW